MGQLEQTLKTRLKAFGSQGVVAYVRWAPQAATATQVLTEACGVRSVTQTGAGAYTIKFSVKPIAIIPVSAREIENDTTHYHVVRVESTSATDGTATVTHKSVAFASVASGPTATDTVDELCFVFLLRLGG